MSNRNEVSLLVKLKDQASKGLQKLTSNLRGATKETTSHERALIKEERALKRAEMASKAKAFAVNGLKKTLTTVGVGLAAISAGLVVFARKVSDINNELRVASDLSGSMVESTSRMAYAARQYGVGLGTLGGHLGNLNEKLQEYITLGTGEGANSMKALNLEAKEFIGLPIDQQYLKIVKTMEALGKTRQEIAFVFKKLSADSLGGIAAGGSAELERLMKESDSIGATTFQKTSDAVDNLNSKIGDVWAVLDNQFLSVLSILEPKIVELSDKFKVWAENWNGLSEEAKSEIIESKLNAIYVTAQRTAAGINLFFSGLLFPFKMLYEASGATGEAIFKVTNLISKEYNKAIEDTSSAIYKVKKSTEEVIGFLKSKVSGPANKYGVFEFAVKAAEAARNRINDLFDGKVWKSNEELSKKYLDDYEDKKTITKTSGDEITEIVTKSSGDMTDAVLGAFEERKEISKKHHAEEIKEEKTFMQKLLDVQKEGWSEFGKVYNEEIKKYKSKIDKFNEPIKIDIPTPNKNSGVSSGGDSVLKSERLNAEELLNLTKQKEEMEKRAEKEAIDLLTRKKELLNSENANELRNLTFLHDQKKITDKEFYDAKVKLVKAAAAAEDLIFQKQLEQIKKKADLKNEELNKAIEQYNKIKESVEAGQPDSSGIQYTSQHLQLAAEQKITLEMDQGDLESQLQNIFAQQEIAQNNVNGILTDLQNQSYSDQQNRVDALNEQYMQLERTLADGSYEVEETREQILQMIEDLRMLGGSESQLESLRQKLAMTTESFKEMQKFANAAGRSITDNISGALTDVAMGTEDAKTAFSKMAQAIIRDIMAMIIRMMVLKMIQAATGMTMGGGGGSMTTGQSFASGLAEGVGGSIGGALSNKLVSVNDNDRSSNYSQPLSSRQIATSTAASTEQQNIHVTARAYITDTDLAAEMESNPKLVDAQVNTRNSTKDRNAY